ncbi:MAG: cytochrome c oxidase subunit 3 [Bacteroidota bacterium]|nr:cytochrome c oxidase subunit 3 [Bacteroidota bacterium]
MNTATIKSDEQRVHEKARKSLLYWAMGSMFIFFSGFCSAYIVMMGNGNWLVFELPDMFYLSTAVIVASSLTLYLAQNAVKKDNFKMVTLGLALTFILGLIFCFLQFQAWAYLISNNIFFVGGNVASSILYVITFLHFIHIVFGLIALLISLIKASRHRYTSSNYLGLSLTSIFWHFLDILWVGLFLFLTYNR